MNRKKVIIIIVVLLVLGAGTYGTLHYVSGMNAEPAAYPVSETIVGRDTITTKVTSKGEVVLLNTELVYANISAEVDEVLVEKNDIIEPGQAVIRYKEDSKEDLEQSIARARLDVQSAEVALSAAKLTSTDLSVERAKFDTENANKAIERAKNDVNDIEREIEKQKAKILEAQEESKKNEILLSVGAISQQTIDDELKAIRDMEIVLDDLRQAKEYKFQEIETAEENYNYSLIVYDDAINKVSDESVQQNNIKQHEISLAKAQLALEQLQQELNDFQLEIISPAGGTVTGVNISRGEITPTNKALIEVADITDYVIKVDVNEKNAGKILVGQTVHLTGPVLGDETLTGSVSKIGYIAETKQTNSGSERVIPVEITVDKTGRDEILKPGFSLDASIIIAVNENTVAIPILSTLSESDGSSFVFIIKDDNTLEKRVVKLGAYADMYVEAEGVDEGESIVTQPSVNMTDGMAVTVINREIEEEPTGGDVQ